MDALTIRQAGPGDARNIAEIHVASWQAAYRGLLPDSYLDALAIDQRLPMWDRILALSSTLIGVLVAAIDDEIVGFCSVGPPLSQADEPGDSLVLHTIYIKPSHERRGIGGALLRHAEGEMTRMGATTAILWVLGENRGARRFYEASGWTDDGVEKLDEIGGQAVREVRYRKRLGADTHS